MVRENDAVEDILGNLEAVARRISGRMFYPPPPISTPREAPWREIEELVDALHAVEWKLDQAITALGGVPRPAMPAPSPVAPPPTMTVDGRLDRLISRLDELLGRLTVTPELAVPAELKLDGRLDNLVKYTLVPVHWGQATGGSKTKLIHSGQHWQDNIWRGYECAIVDGAGAGQIRLIKSNDYQSLTPMTDWVIDPGSTSVYVMRLSLRPISLASLQNVSVTVKSNILATDISAHRASLLRTMCCFAESGVFSVAITKNQQTETRDLNTGIKLTGDALYMFDILIDEGDTVNFQYSTSSTLRILRIQEIVLATQ